jgi:pyruvate/2-oxoacid:ferredoxin oxidoreductase beta subunit
LNEALVQLQVPESSVCLVTDIGCIGLADALFESVHTVHTTHGRSCAFATGIQIADALIGDGRLKTIVLIGDGGAMIGLQHLVNAALMNVNITVLLCNNLLFGMTGGQNSAFSPFDFVTPTTPRGNIVPPLDICRVMVDCGAEFVARSLATDRQLGAVITSAIKHPGFALVEIVELCTEHAIEKDSLTGKSLERIVKSQNQQLGILTGNGTRTEFAARYADKYPPQTREASGEEIFVTPLFRSSLAKQVGIVIAGSAGERVQSSARKLCEGAMHSGLTCTQKNDNPVTQGSGFSISEVIISPNEILYTGIDVPDVVIAVSEDGLQELEEKQIVAHLTPASVLILDSELNEPTTSAQTFTYPFRKEYGAEKAAARAVEFYLRLSSLFSVDSLTA